MRFARAAHELRTPLHGILGAAELLRDSALDDAQRAHVATIEEAARALLRVADDALTAAATDAPTFDSWTPGAPGLDAVAAPCDPRALLDGVRRLLAPAARARGVALTAAVDPAVPAWVAADAGRVRQLLVNLAGNAIRFTEAGEVALTAAVGGRGELALGVRDTGPGLPQAAHAALAGARVRPAAPGTRAGGGAGIGLSIVAELVEALGGALRAESSAAGSTVTVTLPAPAAAAPRTAADECAPPVVRAGTRVLVVDDEPVSLRVTAELLGALGCAVSVAGDAAGARAACALEAYDLVLLDVQLADEDGCELAEALRDEDRALGRPATPVVALTAHAGDAARARCADAGAVECLEKPIGRAGLAAVVARHARAARHAGSPRDARGAAPGDRQDDGALDADAVARLRDLDAHAPGLLARVAEDYAATSARRLDEIARSAAAGDRDAVARAAHALRGASASAGAARAAACAAGCADALRQDDPEALAALCASVGAAAAALARLAAR